MAQKQSTPNPAPFPHETVYVATRPFSPTPGQLSASTDDAADAIDRLVGTSVVDDSKPPRDADPERAWREEQAIKITEARCKRCGADLLAGVLQFLVAGTGQSCGTCGTVTFIPFPPTEAEEAAGRPGIFGKFHNPESEAARAAREARANPR